MKALIFDGMLQMKDVPTPLCQRDEALIRVLMAGICNTDLEIIHGYMGFYGVLGHEFVGVVEAASDHDWVGKRIVGEINLGCGQCDFCRRGLERHCIERSVLGIQAKDGVFAEYTVLPEKNLHTVPDTVSNQEAVFVEPLAASLEILEQIKIEPSHHVAVIGDGKLGLLITQVLLNSGCRLWVIGKHPQKLGMAESFGALVARSDDPPKLRFDVVVEASGAPTGFDLAVGLTKPRGTIVLKSTYHEQLTHNPAKVVIDEINIIGSRCGVFEPAIRLLERKSIAVQPLISKVFPFSDSVMAFNMAQQPETLKILLDFCESGRQIAEEDSS